MSIHYPILLISAYQTILTNMEADFRDATTTFGICDGDETEI
jgi:hypothetical protein